MRRTMMTRERTLAMIKPDAVRNRHSGAIINLIEAHDLNILNIRKLELTEAEAKEFYAVHQERPFYNDLVSFMSSGPVIAMVLEGDDAIARYRTLMGATNPTDAEEGTIRAQYANSIDENAVHGSDGLETAAQEIPFFFSNLNA